MKKINISYVILMIIIALQIMLMIGFGFMKSGYHVDEIFSYGLSNSHFQPFLFDIDMFSDDPKSKFEHGIMADQNQDFSEHTNKWESSEVYNDYVTVNANETFDYASVYYNQTMDVHPPLYYFILNTVCSFFVGSFSKWYGISVNLALFPIIQILLFKLCKETFIKSERVSLLACCIYGFSACAVSTVLFIRMYALLTMLLMAIIYNIIHIMKRTHFSFRHAIGLCVLIFLIALTHYYGIIASFVACAIMCIIMLCQKKFKLCFLYGVFALGGVILSMAFFPAMIKHATRGYRGTDVLDKMKNVCIPVGNTTGMANFVSDATGFGLKMSAFLLVVISLIVIALLYNSIFKPMLKIKDFQALWAFVRANLNFIAQHISEVYIILFTFVMFYVFAAISPNMGKFSNRYCFLLYPLAAMLLACFIAILVKNSRLKKIMAFALVSTLLINSCVKRTDIFLFKNGMDKPEIIDRLKGANCIYFVRYPMYVHNAAYVLRECDEVYVYYQDDNEELKNIVDSADKDKPLYIIVGAFRLNKGVIDGVDWGDTKVELIGKYVEYDNWALYEVVR